MNAGLLLFGRVLVALLFAYFGYLKLVGYQGTVNYFAKWQFPVPEATAVLAIVIELGGGILLLIGWKTRWLAWLLALHVLIATAVAHRFWTYEAAQQFAQTSFFFKNLAIVGALLIIAAAGPGRISLDRR
jgi:putative oxidoreductase